MKTKYLIPEKLLSGLFLYLSLLPFAGHGQGNLMLFPKRIVFEGQKRTEQLLLVNSSDDTANYIISLIEFRMKEDGSMEKLNIPDSGQQFADSFFRFFPRHVVLGPKETQTVKLQLTKNSQLKAGEYRSHLYIRSEKQEEIAGDNRTKKDSNISISIIPIFGFSIPVIIRVGEYNTKVEVSESRLELVNDTVPILRLKFTRNGNMSCYGDIKVNYISPKGKRIEAGEINGVAIYTPTAARQLQLELNHNKGIDYRLGNLEITYAEKAPGKTVFATKTLLLHD